MLNIIMLSAVMLSVVMLIVTSLNDNDKHSSLLRQGDISGYIKKFYETGPACPKTKVSAQIFVQKVFQSNLHYNLSNFRRKMLRDNLKQPPRLPLATALTRERDI